jgi:hypothetical protein
MIHTRQHRKTEIPGPGRDARPRSAHGGGRPLFLRKTTTSQPSKQTSPGPPAHGGGRPLFLRKTTTSQPSKQTSPPGPGGRPPDGQEGPLFPRKTTTSQPSKQTSPPGPGGRPPDGQEGPLFPRKTTTSQPSKQTSALRRGAAAFPCAAGTRPTTPIPLLDTGPQSWYTPAAPGLRAWRKLCVMDVQGRRLISRTDEQPPFVREMGGRSGALQWLEEFET